MTAYDRLKIVRSNHRPTGAAYINALIENKIELHGDRRFGDDEAIVAGVGYLENQPLTFIAIDKGKSLDERIRKNFGCPKPEGYRKALRLMKQAEKFGLPVLCIVDTLGAYCGADGEERGQGQSIAENLMEMMTLRTPVISIIAGEGGSGGALALAVADKVYMLENAVFSVITPDGCASILWKDPSRVAEAVECLRITAEDMKHFGVADEVIPEGRGFEDICDNLKARLISDFKALSTLTPEELTETRYNRYRCLGAYIESNK
ncbi:MAG: acetyl-CoA carboxylase carboxyl transferase subunit alpha [Clostridiales bacterium]|jgi:acetyl-CoA carboxylase carboxyl transferase alpha subunit|nr:acetyl-CoA carboxylase carboxyl transferase subunit alpha [Clostridiales bacterium]